MRYYMIGTYLLPGRLLLRPLGNRRGQTLVEYALVLAFISVVTISVLIAMSGQVKTVFTTVDRQLNVAQNGGATSGSRSP